MIKVRCPVCDQVMEGQGPVEWPHFPFCSARCKTIDLGRWLGEKYRINVPGAGGEPPADGDEDQDAP